MPQNNIKNTAFMGIFLLTFLGFLYYILVFYVVGLRYRPQISTTRKCPDLQLHRRNKFGYGDLTEEFEARASDFWPSTDVLKAIESDGYTPVALSMNILSKNISKQTENTSAENQKATFPDGLNNATHDGVDASMNVSTTLTFLVPNVVHYIAFGTDLNFTFVNYLSYLSVERFIQPEYIFLHGDSIPKGPWWNLTLHNVRNIYHVKRKFSQRSPNGKVFKYPAHISDYLRTEIMLRYGGIYLDPDVLVIKSFDPLRQYSVTFGRENNFGVCNGIIIAERGAPFLRLLREQYHSYIGVQEMWAQKSVINTDLLARLYPHLVHIEDTTLNFPDYRHRVWIYNGWYNWTQNYAIHLWMRLWPMHLRPNGFEDVLIKKTTFAEVARRIIFGIHGLT